MEDVKVELLERPTTRHIHKVKDSFCEINIREFHNFPSDLSNAVVIQGFPSHTLVGILVAGYLIDKLNLPQIGCFTSSKFPARCVIENGLPSHAIRIFGNNKVVVITGEFKPTGDELINSLVAAILEFGRIHRVKLILGVEGFPQTDKKGETNYEKTPLQYVSISKWFYQEMDKQKATPITSGVIAGLGGLTLAEASVDQFIDVGIIVAPTDAEKRYNDTFAAINIVNSINQMIKLDLNTVDLSDKARSLTKKADEKLAELIERDPKEKSSMSPSLSRMYI